MLVCKIGIDWTHLKNFIIDGPETKRSVFRPSNELKFVCQ